MNLRLSRYDWLSVVVLVVTALASAAAWNFLPAVVPAHWGVNGQPDGWWSRTAAVLFLPLFTAGLAILLAFVPRFDPLRVNIAVFANAYARFRLAFVLFMAFLQAATLLAGAGVAVPMVPVISVAMAALLWEVAWLLPQTRRNYSIGLRLPWTLESDAVWETTHHFGGLVFRWLAGAIALSACLPAPVPFLVMMFGILIAITVIVVFSYREYRRQNRSPQNPT
ncbi:MAG: DUF1648 domain-containing protein [Patescibacteria group bacterium]|nr:DUF1648 domain-containing protein [Patescibacteria group bacterium]